MKKFFAVYFFGRGGGRFISVAVYTDWGEGEGFISVAVKQFIHISFIYIFSSDFFNKV